MSAESSLGFRLLYRLFRRLGWLYIPLTIASGLSMTCILLAGGTALLVLGYFGRPELYGPIMAREAVCILGGYFFGVALNWRRIRPGIDRLRNPDSDVDAVTAWQAAVFLPLRVVGTVLVTGTIIGVFDLLPYITHALELNTPQMLALLTASLGAVVSCAVVALFGAELFLRPVVADLASQLPRGWQSPRSAWTVRAKLAGLFLTVAIAAGLGVGSLVPQAAGPAERLALTTAIGTAFAGLIIFPLGLVLLNALLEPVRSLRRATERVARGDFSQPVGQTTADELGEVVGGFNDLQDRVREQFEQVRASRARIVSASDAERRRVERNLHDGAQQRLVSLALMLRMLEDEAGGDPGLADMARMAARELSEALDELRDLARGLHPQVLTTGGLGPALSQLATRSPVPVQVDAPADRFPEEVESTAYFVASEALANVAKYADASNASIVVDRSRDLLSIEIRDDGVGGVDPAAGTGLTGLSDRVAALDGSLTVESPAGAGTLVRVALPLTGGTA